MYNSSPTSVNCRIASDCVLDLKSLARFCTFGVYLDDALRDRFVVRLRNTILHAHLVQSELNFKKQIKDVVNGTDGQSE